MNKTLSYYNKNATAFTAGTIDVNFTETQDKFLSLLPENAYILDFGCGSGRDTKYFLDKGFQVDATDGSEELVKIASETAGIVVKQMLFQELNDVDKYDAIWACSSILHLPKNELAEVLVKMAAAVKDGGIIYTSFKYSEFEGERNGRYFTDFTIESFSEFLKETIESNKETNQDYSKEIEKLTIKEYWITGDVRPGREEEKWLNLILAKK